MQPMLRSARYGPSIYIVAWFEWRLHRWKMDGCVLPSSCEIICFPADWEETRRPRQTRNIFCGTLSKSLDPLSSWRSARLPINISPDFRRTKTAGREISCSAHNFLELVQWHELGVIPIAFHRRRYKRHGAKLFLPFGPPWKYSQDLRSNSSQPSCCVLQTARNGSERQVYTWQVPILRSEDEQVIT